MTGGWKGGEGGRRRRMEEFPGFLRSSAGARTWGKVRGGTQRVHFSPVRRKCVHLPYSCQLKANQQFQFNSMRRKNRVVVWHYNFGTISIRPFLKMVCFR